jgi:hypothetical protein
VQPASPRPPPHRSSQLGHYGGLTDELESLKRDKGVLMVELLRLRQAQQVRTPRRWRLRLDVGSSSIEPGEGTPSLPWRAPKAVERACSAPTNPFRRPPCPFPQATDSRMRDLQQRLSATEARQSTMISFIGRVAANPAALQQLVSAAAAAHAAAPAAHAALVPVGGGPLGHGGYPWVVPVAAPPGVVPQGAYGHGLYGHAAGPAATVLGVDGVPIAGTAAADADAAGVVPTARAQKKRRASAREAGGGGGEGQLIAYVPQPSSPFSAASGGASPLAAGAPAATWGAANGGSATPPGLSPRAAAAAGVAGLQLDPGATSLLEQLQAQQASLHMEAAARAGTPAPVAPAPRPAAGVTVPPPGADEERQAAQLMRDLRLQHDPDGGGSAPPSPAPPALAAGGGKLPPLALHLQQADLGEDDLRGFGSLDQLGSLPFASMPSNDLGLAEDLSKNELWQSLVAGGPAPSAGGALQ